MVVLSEHESKPRRRGGQTTSWQELALIVCRHMGVGPLGVALNDDNVVLGVADSSVAKGILAVGDRLVAVDGIELRGRKLAAVTWTRP